MTLFQEALNAIEYYSGEDSASQDEVEYIDELLSEYEIEPQVETCDLYDY